MEYLKIMGEHHLKDIRCLVASEDDTVMLFANQCSQKLSVEKHCLLCEEERVVDAVVAESFVHIQKGGWNNGEEGV